MHVGIIEGGYISFKQEILGLEYDVVVFERYRELVLVVIAEDAVSITSPPSDTISLILVTVPLDITERPTSEPTHRRPSLSFASTLRVWLSSPFPMVLWEMDRPLTAHVREVYSNASDKAMNLLIL